jgi:outer membrane protein
MMKNLFLISLLTLAVSTAISAQKIGHLDSQSLLSDMPEVRGAESNLEAFQAQLTKRGEKMITDFQRKYQELAQKEQAGEIAPKALEEATRKLKEDEAKIQAYEQEMQQKVVERRDELLQPILDRVNAAIEEVSKEKGYDYIIDLSSGTILFADDQFDITEQVREKLGMI